MDFLVSLRAFYPGQNFVERRDPAYVISFGSLAD